ncbi:MAG: acylneuraminate cytidylyltransferase family protein [Rhodospirillales bacterium]|nr:acylneuraminate cytidylyltransferase family protein [Rhodospirillales bacterium]
MKTLAIIPARGGSKGVPRKNIKILAGKPLIAYTIEAAKSASGIDRVCVSTEDPEIADISRALNAEVLDRPVDLAGDLVPTRDVLWFHAARLAEQGYYPDAVMTLQPTSPLRTLGHIEEALDVFVQNPDADSLVSCVQVPHHYHPLSVMKFDKDGFLIPFVDQQKEPLRRQDKIEVFARNGAAIYLTKTVNLKDYIFGGKLVPYFMSFEESLDIDSEADFALAERIMTKREET